MSDVRVFVVPGQPTGKGRPRYTSAGHAYTPKNTRDAEKDVRTAYMLQYGNKPPLDGPISIEVWAWYGFPKSAPKKLREGLYGKPCQKKPDFDNIEKLVADALNGVAYFDDAQITTAMVKKRHVTGPDQEPRTYVTIRKDR